MVDRPKFASMGSLMQGVKDWQVELSRMNEWREAHHREFDMVVEALNARVNAESHVQALQYSLMHVFRGFEYGEFVRHVRRYLELESDIAWGLGKISEAGMRL